MRRDLDALEREGLIERVHGGAVLAQGGPRSPGSKKRPSGNSPRNRPSPNGRPSCQARFGHRAVGRHDDLGARPPPAAVDQLTVVTNSMNVWRELQAGRSGTAVILTGGEFRTPSDALVGPTADAAIRSLYFDFLFLGVHGIDPVAGLTTPNISEAETNRALISRCRQLVVVADHTKWRVAALCTMAELADVDALVSDDGLPVEARRLLESQVRELVIAPQAGRLVQLGRGGRGSGRPGGRRRRAVDRGPRRRSASRWARMGDIGGVCTNAPGAACGGLRER